MVARPAVVPDFFSRQVLASRRFYHNLSSRPSAGLTVICGGWERCASEYRIRRDSFPLFALEYVASGRGSLLLNDKLHPLAAGAVFTYGGSVLHEIMTDPNEPLVKYFINFSGTRGRRLLQKFDLCPGAYRTVVLRDDVQKAFEDLLRAGHRVGGAVEHLVMLHLEIMLQVIAEAGGPPKSRDHRAFATFIRCRTHLERDFLSFAAIKDAARVCHVDPAYLCRLFSRFDRDSPHRFLQRRKMNYAASLLESGDCLVRHAADALGMNVFHFSRVFKRVHGLSPSAFIGEHVRTIIGYGRPQQR